MTAPLTKLSAAFALGASAAFLVPVPAAVAWLALGVGLWLAVATSWWWVGMGLLAVGASSGSGSDTACQLAPGKTALLVTVQDAPGLNGRADALTPDGCKVRLRFAADSVASGAGLIVVGVANRAGFVRVDHFRGLNRQRAWRYRLRDGVRQRTEALYGPRAGLVDAMVIGHRSGLDPELRQRFVDAGLAHLLAISGLHIGILAGWVLLAARCVLRARPAALAAAVVVWAYVVLLGFPASAVRAALFLTVAAVAGARQRHPGPGAVLALTVVVLLAVDPGIVTSVGVWLSVSAVLGTRIGARWAGILWPDQTGWRGWLATSVFSSTGATLLTAPITAFVFGHVALVGVAANILALPLTTLVVPAVFLSLMTGAWIAGAAGALLAVLESTVMVASAVPGGHLGMDAGVVSGLAWLGVFGIVASVAWRLPTLAVSVRRASVVAGTAVALTLAWVPGRPGGNVLRIDILDVGQGDAITIRTPRGRWLVVDGGPTFGGFDAGVRIAAHLRRLGAQTIEAFMLSHGDGDHVGGASRIISEFIPQRVIGPGVPVGNDSYRAFLRAAMDVGGGWHAVRRGDSMLIDAVRVAVLHPTEPFIRAGRGPNETSVVLRVSYHDFDLLLTGDIGFPAESVLVRAGVSRAEVLKVGHHGSRFSTGPVFLDAVEPAVAVVSVGKNNRYGHPAPEVLERLASRSIPVFRTDAEGGTVTIETDGRYFAVRQGPRDDSWEAKLCRVRRLLRLNNSSSIRSDCTPRRQVTLPTFSTTSRSPGKSLREK